MDRRPAKGSRGAEEGRWGEEEDGAQQVAQGVPTGEGRLAAGHLAQITASRLTISNHYLPTPSAAAVKAGGLMKLDRGLGEAAAPAAGYCFTEVTGA